MLKYKLKNPTKLFVQFLNFLFPSRKTNQQQINNKTTSK